MPPEIGKVTALLRFHRLHRAIVANQKHARTVGLFLQGEAASVTSQSREPLNEIVLAQSLERREPNDFLVRESYLAGPATAGGAALTIVKDGH